MCMFINIIISPTYVIVIRWRRVVYGLYTSGFVFIGHDGVARVVY